jgi:hypothetical protein
MSIKAQAWYVDYMVAMVIFSLAILIYFEYGANSSENSLSYLETDSKYISSSLVSEGIPNNWTSNPLKIGVADDYKLNETKWQAFHNLGYNTSKNIFATRFDFYVMVKDAGNVIRIDDLDGIGNPNYNSSTIKNIDAKNLIRTERFIVYQNRIMSLVVYLWEK